MKRIFTRTFFHFLIAFIIILALSFAILIYTATQQKDAPASVDSIETTG